MKVFGEDDDEKGVKGDHREDGFTVGASVEGESRGKKRDREVMEGGKATSKRETRKKKRVVVDSEDDEDEMLAQEMGRRRTTREVKRLDYAEKIILDEEEDVRIPEVRTTDVRSRPRRRQTPEKDSRPVSIGKNKRKARLGSNSSGL